MGTGGEAGDARADAVSHETMTSRRHFVTRTAQAGAAAAAVVWVAPQIQTVAYAASSVKSSHGGTTTTSTGTGGAQCTLSPRVVQSGGALTMSGTGFKASTALTFILRPGTTVLGSTTSDSTGSFNTMITLPALADGTYRIVVRGLGHDGTEVFCEEEFAVSASGTTTTTAGGQEVRCELTPRTVQAGGTLQSESQHWQPGSTVQVVLQPGNTTLQTAVASPSGDLSLTITLPRSLAAGTYRIALRGTNASGAADNCEEQFQITTPTTTTVNQQGVACSVSPRTIKPGGTTKVTGSGWQPSGSLSFVFRPGTTILATAHAGTDGKFAVNVRIPSGIANGTYRIVVQGHDASGNATFCEESITVKRETGGGGGGSSTTSGGGGGGAGAGGGANGSGNGAGGSAAGQGNGSGGSGNGKQKDLPLTGTDAKTLVILGGVAVVLGRVLYGLKRVANPDRDHTV